MILMAMLADGATIKVHGHRGARSVLPENTMPAFEHAIAAGAEMLELDLAVTKDNVLVVSHDPTMNPSFCAGPAGITVIREMTLAQLRQWDCGVKANPKYPKQKAIPGTRVPTLDEVLSLAAKSKVHFNIETKISPDKPQFTPSPAEFARLVADAIRKHKLESRVMVQSFDYRTLHEMKKLMPKVPLSPLFDKDSRSFVAIAQEVGSTIVSPEQKLVTAEKVAAAHAAGLQVVPWTANTVAEWDKLIDAKVDAIITDDPTELIAYLKKRGLR